MHIHFGPVNELTGVQTRRGISLFLFILPNGSDVSIIRSQVLPITCIETVDRLQLLTSSSFSIDASCFAYSEQVIHVFGSVVIIYFEF